MDNSERQRIAERAEKAVYPDNWYEFAAHAREDVLTLLASLAAVEKEREIRQGNYDALMFQYNQNYKIMMHDQEFIHTLEVKITAAEADRREACPCLHTTPCHPDCTCVKPFMSRGCTRCCSYGSKDQQRRMAEYLAAREVKITAAEAERDGLQFKYDKAAGERADYFEEVALLRRAQEQAVIGWDEEKRIVDRVWKALGVSTYEQAGGKSIDEIVALLRTVAKAFVIEMESRAYEGLSAHEP